MMKMITVQLSFCRSGNIVLFALFSLIAGCAASKLDLSMNFEAPPAGFAKPHSGTLGIDEFIDLRPQVVTSNADKWIGFIPGVLWIEFVTEMPDIYTVFSDYKSEPFTRAVAKAVYRNMERNSIFENTLFLPLDRYTKTDYRIEGALKRTFLKETGYYYGSSLYAWFTRIIGMPYVSYEFSMDITLRMRRIETGEIIWTYNLQGSRTDKYYNVYQLARGREGKDIISYNFSEILKERMPEMLESMRRAL